MLSLLFASKLSTSITALNASIETSGDHENIITNSQEDINRLQAKLIEQENELLLLSNLSRLWEEVLEEKLPIDNSEAIKRSLFSMRSNRDAKEALSSQQGRVSILEQEIDSLNLTICSREAAIESSASKIKSLHRDNASVFDSANNLLNQNLSLRDEMVLKDNTIEQLKAIISSTNEQISSRQKKLNNELLGLGGRMSRVVVLIDTSQSMKGRANSGGSYWDVTKQTIVRWIDNLDVDQIAICFFGDQARVGLEMEKLDNTQRGRIAALIGEATPEDTQTDFIAAMKLAFDFSNVDTIIVFSDGLPSVDVSGDPIIAPPPRGLNETDSLFSQRYEREMKLNVERVLNVHKEILQMVKLNSGVAVNAIGLGDKVFSERTGNLLNDLALKSGGVFIAIPGPVDSATVYEKQ
jgi:hypothetical protein